MVERNKINECFSCINKRTVPGDCHIKCVNPDINMKGNSYGIRSGWFLYPILFDPTWKEVDCANYKSKEE